MKIQSTIVFVCAVTLCIASCKKKEDEPSVPHVPAAPDCQFYGHATHHPGGCVDSLSITGPNDKISGISYFSNCGGGTPGPVTESGRNFIYDGNKVYVINSAASDDRDTLILQAGSWRIQEKRRGSSAFIGTASTMYEYAGDGTLLRSTTSYNSVPYDTTEYTFSNGDMVMQVSGITGHRDTFSYSYYIDKNVPANGYATQFGLVYGNAYTFRSAHLMKGDLNADGTLRNLYTYESDSYGNISKVIRADVGSSWPADTTFYHYRCAVE